jgi:hypothetical protein
LITPLGKSLTDYRGKLIKNAISYDVKNATASIAFGQYVKVEGKVEINILQQYFIFTHKVGSIEGKLKFEMKASFGLVKKFGKDKIGFFVEDKLYFSGLEVTVSSKIKAILGKKIPILDEEFGNEEKPKKYTIFDYSETIVSKIYLYKT